MVSDKNQAKGGGGRRRKTSLPKPNLRPRNLGDPSFHVNTSLAGWAMVVAIIAELFFRQIRDDGGESTINVPATDTISGFKALSPPLPVCVFLVFLTWISQYTSLSLAVPP